MRHRCDLEIGSIRVGFFSFDNIFINLIRRNYRPYIYSGRRPAHAAVYIKPSAGSPGELTVKTSRSRWEISRRDFSSVTLVNVSKTCLECAVNKFSFDSWLRIFVTLLGQDKNSLLIHSSGICRSGSGLIFPGRSGMGKSTITGILGKKNALSDEIVMLTSAGNGMLASSTPFWGELKMGSHKKRTCRPKGLFFIKHGRELRSEKLSRTDALKKLLATVLFFSRENVKVEKMLSLCARACGKIPAYTLAFPLGVKRKELLDAII